MYQRAFLISRGADRDHAFDPDQQRTACGIGREHFYQGRVRPTGLLVTLDQVGPDDVSCQRCRKHLLAQRAR